MKASLGERVILEHGLISNVLMYLGLVGQLTIANICSRTYQITVPWNTRVTLPIDHLCDFPKLKIPSADHIWRRIEATIEGGIGVFYGNVCRESLLPDGYGVFVTSEWVHCGQVKDGVYLEGRKVSVNNFAKLLELTNRKYLEDGSVLVKIERFSEQGVERDFFVDGKKIAKITARLTAVKDAQNWLSMQPNPLRWND
jgi:hypothetical protein